MERRAGPIITAISAVLIAVGGGLTAAVLINNSDRGEKVVAQGPDEPGAVVVVPETGSEVVKYGHLAVLDASTVILGR